jgi:diguanylate cyclase (GGDEF)-like protein
MYDIVRLVDPVKKRVLEYSGHKVNESNKICYAYWQNGKICDNCISVRAFHENRTYIKLEQSTSIIMLVTALPIDSEDGPIILELLKNATDSMLLGHGDYNIGQKMGLIVHNLTNMIIMDHLTKVYNRRFVDDRLPVDIVKAAAQHQLISIIFIDINNMKLINDTYGHLAGDMTLKSVADIMKKSIREDLDWVARYGGDEFVICLTNTDNKKARQTAEKIRKNILELNIPVQNNHVAISYGIQTTSHSSLTAEEILRSADKRMYAAKNLTKSSPPPFITSN